MILEAIYNFFHIGLIKEKILKKKIFVYYENNKEENDCKKEIEFLKENPLGVFNQPFRSKYEKNNLFHIYKDDNCKLYYAFYNGKKLYFKRSFSKKQAKEYYSSILLEQDKESPHRYLTEELEQRRYRTVFDIGAAEGNFALDLINQAEKVYLFECDLEWIEALKHTFAPYRDKIEIVNAFVTDNMKGKRITLDARFPYINNIDLIKMDIEGEEINALYGAENFLKRNKQAILLLCVYHNMDDEREIRKRLNGYCFKLRSGKMILSHRYSLVKSGKKLFGAKGPYFTNGVMEARKDII